MQYASLPSLKVTLYLLFGNTKQRLGVKMQLEKSIRKYKSNFKCGIGQMIEPAEIMVKGI